MPRPARRAKQAMPARTRRRRAWAPCSPAVAPEEPALGVWEQRTKDLRARRDRRWRWRRPRIPSTGGGSEARRCRSGPHHRAITPRGPGRAVPRPSPSAKRDCSASGTSLPAARRRGHPRTRGSLGARGPRRRGRRRSGAARCRRGGREPGSGAVRVGTGGSTGRRAGRAGGPTRARGRPRAAPRRARWPRRPALRHLRRPRRQEPDAPMRHRLRTPMRRSSRGCPPSTHRPRRAVAAGAGADLDPP